jgi:hypothetical protein
MESCVSASNSRLHGILLTATAIGFSGSWVLQDDHVCGYIIAARGDARSVYMAPIHAVLKDIQETLGVNQVSILAPALSSRRDGCALKAGLLCDVATRHEPALEVAETHDYELWPTQDVSKDNHMSSLLVPVEVEHVPGKCRRNNYDLIERSNRLGLLTLVLVILNRVNGM